MGYLNKSVKYIQTLKLEYTHLMSVGFRDRVIVTRSRSISLPTTGKKPSGTEGTYSTALHQMQVCSVYNDAGAQFFCCHASTSVRYTVDCFWARTHICWNLYNEIIQKWKRSVCLISLRVYKTQT